ncbi:MAG: hypothetical protein IJ112_05485 [Oscillospiraceae bacterium]|nr:hypothetical protein [Oscillospiraceae bacterium]
MKTKQKTTVLIAALVIVLIVAALAWFWPRGEADGLAVHIGSRTETVDTALLGRCGVSGTVPGDHGADIVIDAEGVLLRDVLAAAKVNAQTVSAVTVSAADGSTAALPGDALRSSDVFLCTEPDGSLTLVVFGENAQVLSDVTALDIQEA